MNIKKQIPNFITSLNLLCGCMAIVECFGGNLVMAAYLVGLASVFDFLDGMVARLLNVHSEIGKQLDSLADMVTFGVVPGFIVYELLGNSFPVLRYVSFLIPVFSAIRLAKFNIDVRQNESFIGVPTPANTILIASFPLILQSENFLNPVISNPWFLIGLTLLMSWLLVAELPLFALKFKNMSWKDNKIRYIFILFSLLMILLFQFIAIPFIIFLYIALSIMNNLNRKSIESPRVGQSERSR